MNPVSGDGRNGSIRAHLAQPVVIGIGNVESTGSIYRDAVRTGQLRVHGGTAVAPISRGAVPRHSRNYTGGGDPSNPRVEALRHVNIPGAIQRNAEWHVELRASSGSPIARGTSYASARDRGDDAAGRDLSNRVIARVADIYVPASVGRHAPRRIQLRRRRRASISRVFLGTVPRYGGNRTACRDLANPLPGIG